MIDVMPEINFRPVTQTSRQIYILPKRTIPTRTQAIIIGILATYSSDWLRDSSALLLLLYEALTLRLSFFISVPKLKPISFI